MSGLVFLEVMNTPKIRNNIQRDCWNKGYKIIPDKKKLNNKMKCRKKIRPDKQNNYQAFSLGRYCLTALRWNLPTDSSEY
jgi:hypothetical protein